MIKATEKIWHNGKMIDWKDAKIHILSHVTSYGSSVFEGINLAKHRVPAGEIIVWEVSSAAGVPVQISDNVMGALWEKLVLNCAYNALSAISQLPYGRLVQGENTNLKVTFAEDLVLAEMILLRAKPVPL